MMQRRICSRTELLEKETEHEQTGIVENAAAEDSEACVETNSLACCAVVGVVI